MAFDFPNAPTLNQIYNAPGGVASYKWNGSQWMGGPSSAFSDAPSNGYYYNQRNGLWERYKGIIQDLVTYDSTDYLGITSVEAVASVPQSFTPLLSDSKVYWEWSAYGVISGTTTTDDFRARIYGKYYDNTSYLGTVAYQICGIVNTFSGASQVHYPTFCGGPFEVSSYRRSGTGVITMRLYGLCDYPNIKLDVYDHQMHFWGGAGLMAFDFPTPAYHDQIYQSWRYDSNKLAWVSGTTVPPAPSDGYIYMRRNGAWEKFKGVIQDNVQYDSGTQSWGTSHNMMSSNFFFTPLLSDSKVTMMFDAYTTIIYASAGDDFRGRIMAQYVDPGAAFVTISTTTQLVGVVNTDPKSSQNHYTNSVVGPVDISPWKDAGGGYIIRLYGGSDYANTNFYCYDRTMRFTEVQA